MRIRATLPATLGLAVAVGMTTLISPVQAQPPGGLKTLLSSQPTDSLPRTLQRIEADRTRPAEGAEAALALGQLHFARAEYREAANAFARAASRLPPARKPEARYWSGVSWLALGEPTQARAALEEVVRAGGPRRADALLGIAQAWDLGDRPERAYEALTELLQGDPGEVGPAALERFAALAERLGRPEASRKARERLLQEYPRSIEAAGARLALASQPSGSGSGTVGVAIGTFIDRSRARLLASAAKRAGFPDAQVVSRGQGLSAVHTVRLGIYSRRADAQQAGEQAVKALGVTYQIVKAP